MTTLKSTNVWDRTWAEQGTQVPWARSSPEPLLVKYANQATIRKALDIGCGHGVDARYLSSIGARVDAIDISPTAIELAEKEDSKTNYILDDFHTYEFTNKYDFIYDRGYLGPCVDKESCITKVKLLLTENGKWLTLIGRKDGNVLGPPRYDLLETVSWFEQCFNIIEVTASITLNNNDSEKISLWKILLEKKYEY